MRIIFYDKEDNDNSEMTIDQLIEYLQLIRLEWGGACIMGLPQEFQDDDGEIVKWNASISNIEIETSLPDKTEILLY